MYPALKQKQLALCFFGCHIVDNLHLSFSCYRFSICLGHGTNIILLGVLKLKFFSRTVGIYHYVPLQNTLL